jgi:hypothetical protein
MTWSLVETLCRLLEPQERQAVLGDLAESGETGLRALAAVAGLVARRQLGLWKSWRPWVASLGLLPVLLAFSSFASSIVLIIERYPWKPGHQTHQEIMLMLCAATLLTAVLSWAVGFVTASLARRSTVSVAALLATGALWAICQQQVAHTPFGILFTGLLQLALHLAPFAHGLRSGAGCGRLTPSRSLMLAAAALLLLLVLTPFQWPDMKDLLILTFFSWPMLYLMATARWREPRAGSSQKQPA